MSSLQNLLIVRKPRASELGVSSQRAAGTPSLGSISDP